MPRSLLQAPEPLEHVVEEAEAFDAPARVIPRQRSRAYRLACAIGIAIIVVVGVVFWLGLGALVSAWNEAIDAFNTAGVDRTEHFLPPPAASARPADVVRIRPTVAPTPTATPRPAAQVDPTPQASPTAQPSPTARTGPQATAQASPQPTAEAAAGERPPWVLLPQPPPGARVPSGPLVLEARGRGDAPISEIRLELDGAPLPVTVEQRSDAIWRGAANVQVGSGRHAAKAFVVDADGRTGSYGWTFEAGG